MGRLKVKTDATDWDYAGYPNESGQGVLAIYVGPADYPGWPKETYELADPVWFAGVGNYRFGTLRFGGTVIAPPVSPATSITLSNFGWMYPFTMFYTAASSVWTGIRMSSSSGSTSLLRCFSTFPDGTLGLNMPPGPGNSPDVANLPPAAVYGTPSTEVGFFSDGTAEFKAGPSGPTVGSGPAGPYAVKFETLLAPPDPGVYDWHRCKQDLNPNELNTGTLKVKTSTGVGPSTWSVASRMNPKPT